MMGIRVVCFGLMILVQPFGWWTIVFGIGAIFIPYVAVVLANVSEAAKSVPAVPVEREIEERMTPWPATPRPRVIRVDELHQVRPAPADGATAADPTAPAAGPAQEKPQSEAS